MKTKRNLIIAIGLCLSSYCLADNVKEKTENWLQNAPAESGRPEIPGDEDDGMTAVPVVQNPVGDAIWVLVGMSAVYALYRSRPKRKLSLRA
jgi:hypothetical protein